MSKTVIDMNCGPYLHGRVATGVQDLASLQRLFGVRVDFGFRLWGYLGFLRALSDEGSLG